LRFADRVAGIDGVRAVIEDVKKCSFVRCSIVIFGRAFGAASLTKHCAKRHHRRHMKIEQ
jgi:hypothetical protein